MTTTSHANTLTITDEQKRQFRQDGYFILENAVPAEHLEILRDVCARYIEKMHAEMDRLGTETLAISHRGKRYFINNRHQEMPELQEFLYSDLLAEICRATLGDDVFLFNEQYVVKAAEKGMQFAWHQDSGYVGFPHREYLSCWVALDDMRVENGTVYMLPFARGGVRDTVEHKKEAGSNDMIGYFGADPGDPALVPAGSIVVFSSDCFHRGGQNTTDQMRRSYLVQYTPEPMIHPETGQQHLLAEPFIQNGERVR